MTAQTFEPRFRPGAVLAGRFRIERTIGRGGMGVVYGALHLSLNQYVAIKVLEGEASTDADAIARFRQEAQIASQLMSPNIVRVHDLGQTERGEPFIVMELLTGRDLDSVINDPRRLTIPECISIITQACVGVATAHAAGLVHRDLKPANLYLARQPNGSEVVKVLDFGLTKVLHQTNVGLTQSTSSFGTPQYMSPEQIMSAKYVDARCDQHALALILFELLAKKPAYQAETSGALTVMIVTQKPPSVRALRADVPAKLDQILQKAMAKKPRERFADLGGFARAIASFGAPDANAAAEQTVRALRESRVVRSAPDASLMSGPEHPSMSSALTEGSFSSHFRRGKPTSSLFFWAFAATVLLLAISATMLFLLFRTPRAVANAAVSSTAEASVEVASEAAKPGDTSTPVTATAIPTATATATATATSTSTATTTSTSTATSTPTSTSTPKSGSPPTHPSTHTSGSTKDPFDVFGKK